MLQQLLPYSLIVGRLSVALIIALCFFLSPGEVLAKKKRKKPQKFVSPKLIAGDVQAQLPLQKRDRNYARGRFVFAEIKVFNKGRNHHQKAELIFETEDPIINSIVNLDNGRNIIRRYALKRRRHVVIIRGLSNKKPRIFWIELKLGKVTLPRSRKEASRRLKITLRARNTEGEWETDTTHMSWKLSNCGASYHKALSGGSNSIIYKLNDALKHINKREKHLPGRWIFAPLKYYKTETVYKDVCIRRKNFRNRRTGKYYKKCIASRKVKKAVKSLIKRNKEESNLLQVTQTVISAGGRDPDIQVNTDNYWVVRKISEDIKRYLEQKKNSAICTGAIQMTEYYEAKFEPVQKRSEQILSHLTKAVSLLKANAYKYFQLAPPPKQRLVNMRSEQGSEQNVKNKNLILLDTILNRIASASGNEKFLTSFRSAGNIPARLKAVKNFLQPFQKELDLNEDTKKQLRSTLTMIESTYYLQTLSSRYESIVKIVDDSIKEIRNAHETYCNC